MESIKSARLQTSSHFGNIELDYTLVKNQWALSATWKIPQFSKIQKSTSRTISSPVFSYNLQPWRLVLYPKGNASQYLAVYLAIHQPDKLDHDQSRSVQFSISVLSSKCWDDNPSLSTKAVLNKIRNDFGFARLLPFSQLTSKSKYLTDDVLTVKITFVCKPVR